MADKFDYTAVARDALEIITEFGVTFTLIKRTAGEYDPDTGINIVAESSQNVQGVIFPQGKGLINAGGSLIEQGDSEVLLPVTAEDGSAIKPAVNDLITAAGIDKTIISVNTLSPAGVDVLHTLNVRD